MASKPKKATTRRAAKLGDWPEGAQALRFGRDQFRFHVTREQRKLPTIDIDPWVETANWEKQGTGRTGQVTFRRPLGAHAAEMIAATDRVRCQWAQTEATPFRTLWEMDIATPSHQLQEGVITVALAGSLGHAAKSKVAWKFRTDRQHRHGWTADQMTLAVARRFHVKVGTLPKGKYRIPKYISKSASPVDVITWAWTQERKNTGRRFNIDTSSGTINVVEVKEPRFLLIMGAAMLDGTVTQSLTGIASAVVATVTRKGTGHQADKLRAKVVDAGRQRRYGYIVKTLTAPTNIHSTAALRKWARQQLAELYKSKRTITFTHPGIPLVDTGTPLRAFVPEADVNELVFVTDARHDLSAGSYTMDLTVGFSDPWQIDLKKQATTKKKSDTARRRKRYTTLERSAPPTPRRAAVRAAA